MKPERKYNCAFCRDVGWFRDYRKGRRGRPTVCDHQQPTRSQQR